MNNIPFTSEVADEIEKLYDAAIENECTCYAMPERPCRFCNAWEKARKETLKLINSTLKTAVKEAWEEGFNANSVEYCHKTPRELWNESNARKIVEQ